MATRFCILGSGSAGNCAFLQTESARILVDVGFSARRIREMLHDIGEKLESIDAIFLTHEHGDHASGIESLKKFPRVRLFANAATARAVQSRLEHRANWQLFETGARFRFGDLDIESFSVPHDAADPVGFLFHSGHEDDLFSPRRTLAWLTDLGHAPQHIHERLRSADVIAIESNHCPEMLKADLKRPWPVKQRISGRHGHLSNQSMRELLEAVASPRWQRVFLTHLSRECNSPAAVELSVATLRARLTCQFSIVASGGSTPFYEFA